MDKQPLPVFFGEWIKRRRRALDLTQDELAKRAGCSLGALRKIESGDRKPSKQLAGLLARVLEIPTEDRQTFVRIARGELNLERLGETPTALTPSLAQLQPVISAGNTRSVPAQSTPLIGREAEYEALVRLFSDQQCRLLTLIGIGGIGKTRLAIEFATQHQEAFPGGIYYFPLTSEGSIEGVISAIANVLGYTFSGPANPKAQLFNFITKQFNQPALFVFDNLEHLLIPASPEIRKSDFVDLVCDLLQTFPKVTILGTSRERLNIHGEWTYELHGLSVPPINYVGQLEDYNAVALFIKSAQRMRAEFRIDREDQDALIRICQLVEGVPLALELAAAWVGMLSCQEIAQEIQANMDFLTTSMRDVPERHRSIRATFDHSWKLLTEEERKVLRQLSVFQGGFDRQAAQKITGTSLSVLASLSDKSLLRRSEHGRYDLHQVIRQYSLSHLNDSPDPGEVYERHSEYYLEMVQASGGALRSAAQQETLKRLTGEVENIRLAWDWAVKHQGYALLARSGRAFGWYFEIAGIYQEGCDLFQQLHRALSSDTPEKERKGLLALAQNQQALLLFRIGDVEQAQSLYEKSILITRSMSEPIILAEALIFLGIIQHMKGEYGRGKSSLQEGLALAQQNNDLFLEAYATYNIGYIDSQEGQSAEGYQQMLRGLDLLRRLGDPHYIALGLNYLIPTMIKLGIYAQARANMYESIRLCEQAKNRWGMGAAFRFLGAVCVAEGQYAEALTHLHKSLETFGELHKGWHIAISLVYIGDAQRLSGELISAKSSYLEALRISHEFNAIPVALNSMAGLCQALETEGEHARAMRLCDYIVDHPFTEEETRAQMQRLRADLEHKLDAEQRATRLAGAIPFDDLVNDLLSVG